MPATLSSLVVKLTAAATIQASESALTNTVLTDFVSGALVEHNPLLPVGNLPAAQEEAVVLLAWIRVCLTRAQVFARDGSLQGAGGYGEDRSNPVKNNIALSKELRARYAQLCGQLGLTAGSLSGGVVCVSNLTTQDARYDTVTPLSAAPVPPVPLFTLAAVTGEDTSVVLTWSVSTPLSDFDAYLLFHADSGITLYQAWNFASAAGAPRLHEGATLLNTIVSEEIKSVRVADLNRTLSNRFLLVVRTRAGKYAYSEELTLAPL